MLVCIKEQARNLFLFCSCPAATYDAAVFKKLIIFFDYIKTGAPYPHQMIGFGMWASQQFLKLCL